MLLLISVFGQLDELGEDARRPPGVQERHPDSPYPDAGLLVYQFDAALFELFQGPYEVVHLVGDVVEALAPFGKELAYGRVGTSGLNELYFGLAHLEHRGDYALLLDLFRLARRSAEVLLIKAGRSGEILDRVT